MFFYYPISFTTHALPLSFYYDLYLVILFLVLVLLFVGLGLFTIVNLFNNRFWSNSQTQSIYECGFLPFEEARVRFEPKFYMIALSFIIFDLEVCFVFPWLLVFSWLHGFYFVLFFIFLLLILFGFVYEWKSQIFDWNLLDTK